MLLIHVEDTVGKILRHLFNEKKFDNFRELLLDQLLNFFSF